MWRERGTFMREIIDEKSKIILASIWRKGAGITMILISIKEVFLPLLRINILE